LSLIFDVSNQLLDDVQFDDLQECYLQKRRRNKAADRVVTNAIKDGGKSDPWTEERRTGLDDFHSVLTAITRYSKLRVIAELRHGDLFHSSNIVSRY
jgi:E3 ubiquitin-protein ligase RFWD2